MVAQLCVYEVSRWSVLHSGPYYKPFPYSLNARDHFKCSPLLFSDQHHTVIQSRKEFQKPVWIAFVELEAAFDSVDRKALWKLLRSLGLHSKVVDLMEALYTDTCSCSVQFSSVQLAKINVVLSAKHFRTTTQ